MNGTERDIERCLAGAFHYEGHTIRDTPYGPEVVGKILDPNTGQPVGEYRIALSPIARALTFI
jgi:hypothetical protein